MRLSLALAACGAAYLLNAGLAGAHATLETAKAPAGASYKAIIRIGHGCDGSPTAAIRVQIPEGVIAVKPMPKPGWQLATTLGDYKNAYDYYGTEMTKGVTEVAWSGGSLPDDFYDEFIFRGMLTDFEPGTVLHFPVVQECAEGVHRWIEIPKPGEDPDSYEEPAPSLTILEAAPGEH
jgi:uncharacterized protein YcnI